MSVQLIRKRTKKRKKKSTERGPSPSVLPPASNSTQEKSAKNAESGPSTLQLEATTPEGLAELKRVCATAEFNEFKLSKWIIDSCRALGMKRPTPVQYCCLPPILRGRNCVACAQTGSGKTATFVLPILEHLSHDPYGIFALVLAPTRELAMQIGEQFRAIGAPMRLRVCVAIGGLSLLAQSLELSRRPHVVVGTLGRLAAHIQSADPPKLNALRYLVLDEADRMLHPDFEEDLQIVVAALPKKRQTLFFSATMSGGVEQTALGASSVKNPFVFDISGAQEEVAIPETLQQWYLFVPSKVKPAYLFYILREYLETSDDSDSDSDGGSGDDKPDRAASMMVFCATTNMCHLLTEIALELEIPAVCLHSRLTQNRRIAALGKFKSGVVPLLFCTDVASRGLDIPQVEMVINFDIPQVPKDYVHRIGRAARAGRSGRALSIVSQHDIELIQTIEGYTGTKLNEFKEVSEAEAEVLKILTKVSTATRVARMRLAQDNWSKSLVPRRPNEHKRRRWEDDRTAI